MENKEQLTIPKEEYVELKNKVKVLFALLIVMAMVITVMFALMGQSIGAYGVCINANNRLVNEASNFNNQPPIDSNVRTVSEGN